MKNHTQIKDFAFLDEADEFLRDEHKKSFFFLFFWIELVIFNLFHLTN